MRKMLHLDGNYYYYYYLEMNTLGFSSFREKTADATSLTRERERGERERERKCIAKFKIIFTKKVSSFIIITAN
jgi:hypothetical protein